MKGLALFLSGLLTFSFLVPAAPARAQSRSGAELAGPALVAQTGAAALLPRLILQEGAVWQGDPLLCWIESPYPIFNGRARLYGPVAAARDSSSLFFMPSASPGYLYGILLPVATDFSPGPVNIVVSGMLQTSPAESGPLPFELIRTMEIRARDFASEDIPLDAANTAIRSKPDPAKTAEAISFADIFATADPTAVFAAGSFAKPLSGTWRQTAGFADARRYLYAGGGIDTSSHGGIDLGAPSGTPVLACLPGRVVFAKPRIVTGNTIVLEHLPGLFSIYMHLSSMSVKEGDLVEASSPIGAVGSTGLSTGPHLHWEMRIGQTPVYPLAWLGRPLLPGHLPGSPPAASPAAARAPIPPSP